MTQPNARDDDGNLLQRLLDRLEGWARRSDLDRMKEDDLRHLARDVGIDASDLARLAAKKKGSSQLLYSRLQSLGLSMAEIEASGVGTARDMERTCGLCPEQALCGHDLGERPEATDWRQVCPNAWTFDEMERLKKVQS